MEQNKNYEADEISIDIGELLLVVFRKMHMIILAGIIFAAVAFLGTKTLITPQYDSVTKIYVISKQDENSVTTNDLQTGALLTKDYMEMVKSRPVMEEVIAELNLDMTVEKLAKSITVETPSETRMIKITVRSEEPELAKNIADSVREVASVQIRDVMNIDAVNTVEEANLPTKKATPNTMLNILLGGIIGALIAMVIIVLVHILDDTIKSPDDVERYLDLNVLASIPIKDGSASVKKVRKTKAKGKRSRK